MVQRLMRRLVSYDTNTLRLRAIWGARKTVSRALGRYGLENGAYVQDPRPGDVLGVKVFGDHRRGGGTTPVVHEPPVAARQKRDEVCPGEAGDPLHQGGIDVALSPGKSLSR